MLPEFRRQIFQLPLIATVWIYVRDRYVQERKTSSFPIRFTLAIIEHTLAIIQGNIIRPIIAPCSSFCKQCPLICFDAWRAAVEKTRGKNHRHPRLTHLRRRTTISKRIESLLVFPDAHKDLRSFQEMYWLLIILYFSESLGSIPLLPGGHHSLCLSHSESDQGWSDRTL